MSDTGKIEYAPDYRIEQVVSAACPRCGNPDCEEIIEFIKSVEARHAEHLALKDAVVAAARTLQRSENAMWSCVPADHEKFQAAFERELAVFDNALDALTKFEAKAGIEVE